MAVLLIAIPAVALTRELLTTVGVEVVVVVAQDAVVDKPPLLASVVVDEAVKLLV